MKESLGHLEMIDRRRELLNKSVLVYFKNGEKGQFKIKGFILEEDENNFRSVEFKMVDTEGMNNRFYAFQIESIVII